MKYKCPSCKMQWTDSTEPLEMLTEPLCVFCSTKHTEKELLNWQMDHIEEISQVDFVVVIRHFYRYIERKIKALQDEIDGLTPRREKETDPR